MTKEDKIAVFMLAQKLLKVESTVPARRFFQKMDLKANLPRAIVCDLACGVVRRVM